MLAFVVGEAAEPQAAGRQGFQDAKRRLVPTAITHMHAMLLKQGAERALKNGRGKSEFGRALRHTASRDRKASGSVLRCFAIFVASSGPI